MQSSNENTVSMKQLANKSNSIQEGIEYELSIEESKFYMTEVRGFLPEAELEGWETNYSLLHRRV